MTETERERERERERENRAEERGKKGREGGMGEGWRERERVERRESSLMRTKLPLRQLLSQYVCAWKREAE